MLEVHRQVMIKMFADVYIRNVAPTPIRGSIKPIEEGSTIKEPDKEMYDSFEEATQLGLKELDRRVKKYFIA